MSNLMKSVSAAALSLLLVSCTPYQDRVDPAAVAAEEMAIEARTFLARVETELAAMNRQAAQAYWNQATNITPETNAAAAAAGANATKLAVSFANESKKFDVSVLPPDLARKIRILRGGITIPAPSREGAAEELSRLTTDLDAAYGTGKFEYQGKMLTLDEASTIIETSRNPDVTKAVWEGWHSISPPMKDNYAAMVSLANEGARELGYRSLDQMWLSGYDMAPEEMEAEVARLWGQVEPLYKELHCYTRTRLNQKYGDGVQAASGPIRADLLGNMWAQQWSNIYDVVQPPTAPLKYDVTARLVQQRYTPVMMVETAEAFFVSLGLDRLPQTFWERSMIVRPEGREVQCHASAWNLDDEEDVRIKMCTEVNSEDFYTVHHELGHNYYQRAYKDQDFLFRNGAHDGFHEAIGDFISLSITPEYFRQIGLITAEEMPAPDSDTALLMQTALDKIAFLPFAI